MPCVSGKLIRDATISGDKLENGAVSNVKITDATIEESKLSISNDPVTNYLLSWTGAALVWAQIVAGGIADNAVTEPKLAMVNATVLNAALTWNGSAMAWSLIGTDNISDASVTHGKLATTGAPGAGQVLSYNGAAMAWVDNLDKYVRTDASDGTSAYLSDKMYASVFEVVVDVGRYITIKAGGVTQTMIIDDAVNVDKLAHSINATSIAFNADKVDGKDVDDAQTSTSYLWTADKIQWETKNAAVAWYALALQNDPPPTPSTGDRYVVSSVPTGDWIGYGNKIAEWTGVVWRFYTPLDGHTIYLTDGNLFYTYDAGEGAALKWKLSLTFAFGTLDYLPDGTTYLRVANVNASHLITADSIAAAQITPTKMNASGTPADNKILILDAGLNFTWEDAGAAADTYKVMADAGDATPGYLDAKFSPTYFTVGIDDIVVLAATCVDTGRLANDAVTADKLAHNINATAIGFNADKVDGADLNDGGSGTSVLWSSTKVAAEIAAAVAGMAWQEPVINVAVNDPPGGPASGDRYVVGEAPTGAWIGHEDNIAEWDGVSAWNFTVPVDGMATYNETDEYVYIYDADASTWKQTASMTPHNSLAGLQGGAVGTYYHLTSEEYANLYKLKASSDDATSDYLDGKINSTFFEILNAVAASIIYGTGTGKLLYTAQTPGAAGNNITVWHKAGVALSVFVLGTDIEVTLNSGVSTAANVKAAVDADPAAAALVSTAIDTAGVVGDEVAAVNLIGGLSERLSVVALSIGTGQLAADAVTAAKIADASISDEHLDATNAAGDGLVPAWNVTSSKFTWTAVALADEKVKAASGDPTPGYLDSKISSSFFEIVTNAISIKAGSIGTTQLTNSGVTSDKLASTVAGAGLIGGAGTALAVNPGTDLKISGDTIALDYTEVEDLAPTLGAGTEGKEYQVGAAAIKRIFGLFVNGVRTLPSYFSINRRANGSLVSGWITFHDHTSTPPAGKVALCYDLAVTDELSIVYN